MPISLRTKIIAGLVSVVALLLILSFAPLPGYYNVAVTVDMEEVQALVVSYYQINSVNPSVTGQSTIIDWAGFGLSFTFGEITGQFKLTVCVGGTCSSATESKLLPSLPWNTNLDVSDTLHLSYIHQGQYTVTATLYNNGAQVAQENAPLCVGSGC